MRLLRRLTGVADLEQRVEGLEFLLAEMRKDPAPPVERPRDRALAPGACRPPVPVPSAEEERPCR